MTDEVGVIISSQTYGETLAANQIAYLKSDGKWWKARANATATSTGEIGLVLDAGTSGRILKLGYRENSSWNWTPGAPVYLSAATAGALTQTRPTGAGTVVRIVGYPASATVLWVDPADPLTLATVEGLTATKGDLIAGQAGAWTTIGVSTDPWACLHPNSSKSTGLEWMPPVPALLNKVVRCLDGAASPNNLEIHMAYIPFFESAGFSQSNLNGITCGGFWVDRFLACQPLASNVSRGGLTPNDPGAGVGASSKPHVVPWTDIDWAHTVAAIENRNGSANKSATGTPTACAVYASAADTKAEMLVASTDHLIGRHIEIVQDGVTYYRRIVRQGIADEAKYIKIYPPLPADITTADTYVIKGFHLTTPYERFSIAAWARKHLYQYGLPYPRGNNDWGKDVGDARAVQYEGLADPVEGGYNAHEKSRCLTGSGPLSWSLNGQENGIWDLNGNTYEWDLQQVVADGTAIVIAPGYPGAGTAIKPTGTPGQKIATMYDVDVPAGGLCLNSEINIPATLSAGGVAEYDYDGCWFNAAAATYAALRGGYWGDGAYAGLFALHLNHAPTYAYNRIGFRGAF